MTSSTQHRRLSKSHLPKPKSVSTWCVPCQQQFKNAKKKTQHDEREHPTSRKFKNR